MRSRVSEESAINLVKRFKKTSDMKCFVREISDRISWYSRISPRQRILFTNKVISELEAIDKEKEAISIWDAQHPARKKAIRIIEKIGELIGREEFADRIWFQIEDEVTRIIAEKEGCKCEGSQE